jgi:hypothetical protein
MSGCLETAQAWAKEPGLVIPGRMSQVREIHPWRLMRTTGSPSLLQVASWAACLLLATLPCMLAAKEPARLALIIGNARYEGGDWLPLRNPGNDAQAIARALRGVGFETVGCEGAGGVCLDVNLAALEKAVRTFAHRLQANPGAIAFVYYSGHGVQASRTPGAAAENYLIPIGSRVEEETDVNDRAVSVQWLLDQVNASQVQSGIVVLDACRDNVRRITRRQISPAGGGGTERHLWVNG